LKDKRFNNVSRYPPIKSVVSKGQRKEQKDITDDKLYLDMGNKNNNKSLKRSNKSTLSEKTGESFIVSKKDSPYLNPLSIDNKYRNEYKNHSHANSVISYDNANNDYENDYNYYSNNYNKINDVNQNNDIKNTNNNQEDPEIQKSIEFISRVYEIQKKSRLPPSIRKMYTTLSMYNDYGLNENSHNKTS